MSSYDAYDLHECDPYLIDNSSCLSNRLNITNTGELNKAEGSLAFLAQVEISETPVTATFDLAHLKEIHRRLFSDVYEWAGDIRAVEISKSDMLFLPYSQITLAWEVLSTELNKDSHLESLTVTDFLKKAAYYFGRINQIHAFREGNGRAQRIWFDQLCELRGLGITWEAISGEQMAKACKAARSKSPCYFELERLFKINLSQDI
jgi:cell filamentation protein